MVLPRFLAELKHRKVYRAAVVYAAVGWALLEAADVVMPRLGFPDWAVDVVLAFVLFGFPLAIVFAWIFDVSPQGIVRTEPLTNTAHPHRFSLTAIVEFVLIVALVVVVGGLYVDRLALQQRLADAESAVQWKPNKSQPAVGNPEQYRAIAVLPFADMSEAGNQAWFAEGIAEELLIALSRLDQLSVMARTSSFAFKNTDKTVAEIAEILGVQAVLEGSVRRSGDRVRITAQLVDASNGFHIWSGSYEQKITDIFKLQDELAKSVVEALRIELGVDPSRRLVAEQTLVPEAYNWFMRGRAAFDWANAQGIQRSISYYEKAVEADPGYAMAWGYLSYARCVLMIFRSLDEAGPSTIAAMERALALDPEQSEALTVKALMAQLIDSDWEAAGRMYKRAIAANQSGYAISNYALLYLQFINQQRHAIELYTNFEKLDPLHAGYKSTLAGLLHFAGDVDKAIIKARESIQLKPGHMLAINYLVLGYTDKNDTAALDSLLESIPPAVAEMPEIKSLIARSYAVRGENTKARKIYEDLIASSDSLTPMALSNTAILAITLGDIDGSIDLMELLEKSGSWVQFWVKLTPKENTTVREHPRYQALLKRMGLDDASVRALNEKVSFK
jgi:TolB-like protein